MALMSIEALQQMAGHDGFSGFNVSPVPAAAELRRLTARSRGYHALTRGIRRSLGK
jgi:hypothetical protein